MKNLLSHSIMNVNSAQDMATSSNNQNKIISMSQSVHCEKKLFDYKPRKTQSFLRRLILRRRKIFRSRSPPATSNNFLTPNSNFERRFSIRNFLQIFAQFRKQLFSSDQLKNNSKNRLKNAFYSVFVLKNINF